MVDSKRRPRTDGVDPDRPRANGAVGHGSRPSLEELLRSSAGPGPRHLPGRSALEAAAKLAVRPHVAAGRALDLVGELGKVVLGVSAFTPEEDDPRYGDDAWRGNFLYRRVAQTHLAAAEVLYGAIADLDLSWRTDRRVRLAAENLVEALAPSNNPLLNPAVLKAVLDTGGGNFVRGARRLRRDMAAPPRIPTMADSSAFELGEDMAVSEGQVVHRTEVFELIQYAPATKRVHEVPVLIVGAMINKFYLVDLRPGRSLVEHLVGQGLQVFVVSWRNPGPEHAEWDLETYAAAVLEAKEAAAAVCGTDRTGLLALCAGAQVTSTAVGHLAATDRLAEVGSLATAVAVLDTDRMGTPGAVLDRLAGAGSMAETARNGYLDGRTLASVFAWLRPSDLIWRYWVDSYLLGHDPPAFDVLVWNADQTNLPAGLHRDLVELGLRNALAEPGGVEVMGTPIDLSQIDCDLYVVAALDDHLVPWESAYRSARLFGSEARFVLSNSGHVASQVNPPDNPKASFQQHPELVEDPQRWLAASKRTDGSWWVDYSAWLAERSGPQRPAPKRLGGRGYAPLGPAPGEYVLETVGHGPGLMPYTKRGPRIYYERSGRGEPMLFVTGWMLSSAVFETVLPHYEEHFDCIVFDNRWAGRSAAPPRLTSIPELATDATGVLDELGLDSAHVYGISLGGMIAIELALRHPERVRGLVLVGTSPGGPRASPPGPRMIGSLVSRLGRDAVGQRLRIDPPPIGAALFTPEFPKRHPERAAELLEPFGRHRVTPWGALAQTLATVYHETVSRLPQMQAPTLLIHGGRDSMSPLANSRIMAGLIPDAELVIVPDTGHGVPLERPELSVDILVEWIKRRSPIPAGTPRSGPSRRVEPLTRALGLPIGMLRTGDALVRRGAEMVTGRRRKLTAGEAPTSPRERVAEIASEG